MFFGVCMVFVWLVWLICVVSLVVSVKLRCRYSVSSGCLGVVLVFMLNGMGMEMVR